MPHAPRSDWKLDDAVRYCREKGPDAMQALIDRNDQLPGDVKEHPNTILRMAAAVAQVRQEQQAAATELERQRHAESIQVGLDQNKIAQQSADAALRSAIAAEAATAIGLQAATAAVRSADAGGTAAQAASDAATSARKALWWNRFTGICAAIAIVVSVIALFRPTP